MASARQLYQLAVMLKKYPCLARILRRDQYDFSKGLQSTLSNILEIANWGCYKIQCAHGIL